MVLVAAVLVWLPVDPRPAIAAAVYLGPLLGGYLVTTVLDPLSMAWWGVGPPLAIATITGALLVASAARARHLSRL